MNIEHPRFTDLPALRNLWQEAFGDTDAFWQAFLTTGYSAYRCRCVLADDRPAAALYWFDCPWKGQKLAYLYGIATKKEYQGQGLCKTLMQDTHAYLRQQGYYGTVLVPGSVSLREFYRGMGYADCGGIREETVPASDKPAQLREITLEEYEKLRQQLLPYSGVELTGEMLAFFGKLADFYAADRFVFALSKEEDRLFVPELLGSCPDPGSIAAALGKASVTLRTPGVDPFAMFLPLTAQTTPPEYFGIALD